MILVGIDVEEWNMYFFFEVTQIKTIYLYLSFSGRNFATKFL